MRLFFLINGYFYSQFTQGSFLYKPLKTREPLGKNTPFSFFGLPPKIPPLLLHESSILVVPTSTEVGRPGCYSRLECERAEAAALHVDLASWQRCLEGLFIAWVNGFVL